MERIGAYRVVRRLASASGGEALLAKTDGGPLGSERTVVLKLFPSGGEELERAFAREASAYAQIGSGAVARLVDFFAVPAGSGGGGGQLCIVLEHVDGPSLVRLRTLLKSASLELDDRAAVYIAASLFEALAAAHAADPPLVHRDVNPSNVLLAWDGQVKLTDFGVARLSGVSHGHGAAAARGTYGYLAPEQARSEEASPRADVYSAGIVLWELLTRRRAFQRGVLLEEEAMRAMAEPRLAALDSVRPELPQSVRDVVRRALEPRVEHRTIPAGEAAAILSASIVPEDARRQLSGSLIAIRASAESQPSLPPRASISPERKMASSIPAPPNTKRGVAPPPSSDDLIEVVGDSSRDPAADEFARRPPPTPRRSLVDLGPVKGTSATARLAFAVPNAPGLPRPSTMGMAAVTPPPVPPMGQLPPAPPPMTGAVSATPDSDLPTQPLNRTQPLPSPFADGSPAPRAALRSSPPLALPPPVGSPAFDGARLSSPTAPAEPSRVPSGPAVHSTSAHPVAMPPKPVARGIPVLITLAIVGFGAMAAYLRSQPKPTHSQETGHDVTTSTASTESPTPKALETRPSALDTAPLSAVPTVEPHAGVATPPASAVATAAVAPPSNATSPAASDEGALASEMGRIRTAGSVAGRRIFVDDKTLGQTPASVVVRCGRHTVRLGSSGKPQTLDVPCGGDVSVNGR